MLQTQNEKYSLTVEHQPPTSGQLEEPKLGSEPGSFNFRWREWDTSAIQHDEELGDMLKSYGMLNTGMYVNFHSVLEFSQLTQVYRSDISAYWKCRLWNSFLRTKTCLQENPLKQYFHLLHIYSDYKLRRWRLCWFLFPVHKTSGLQLSLPSSISW